MLRMLNDLAFSQWDKKAPILNLVTIQHESANHASSHPYSTITASILNSCSLSQWRPLHIRCQCYSKYQAESSSVITVQKCRPANSTYNYTSRKSARRQSHDLLLLRYKCTNVYLQLCAIWKCKNMLSTATGSWCVMILSDADEHICAPENTGCF